MRNLVSRFFGNIFYITFSVVFALVFLNFMMAAIANYTVTVGAGTTFGSIAVATVNYAQQLVCDPATPAQCVAVSAAGAAKVDGSAVTQPVSGTVSVSALPANASVNVTQFGGSAVITGTGTGGAGIPRVTVSSDSTVNPTTALNWGIYPQGQSISNISNNNGVGAWGITNSAAPSATFWTTGLMQPLMVNTNGNLKVEQPDWSGSITSVNTVTCTPPTVNTGCAYAPVIDGQATLTFTTSGVAGGAIISVYGSTDGGTTYNAIPIVSVLGTLSSVGTVTTNNGFRVNTAGLSNIGFGNSGTGSGTTTIAWRASVGSGGGLQTSFVSNANANGQATAANSSPVVDAVYAHTVPASSTLANNLVIATGTHNLGAFNCTGITGGASGFCIAYNGTTAPATGALTATNVLDACFFDTSARGCSLSRLPNAVSYSTGIVILISQSATPYTYTAGATGFISADYN